MMNTVPTCIAIEDYVAGLALNGTRVLSGSTRTYWVQHESYSLMRMPTFELAPPSEDELKQVLFKSFVGVASYLVEPDDAHPANASLYVCADQTYCLEKLTPAMRRNVRRGAKEFTVEMLTPEQVLLHGVRPFCDTRRRVGLSDGTSETFQRRFGSRVRSSGHVFVGAWRGEELAAFLSITKVDGWAEIEGCFSQDAMLNGRPNDLLMYSVLSKYLVEERLQLVSYGLSSIQQADNVQGLHAFKTKVGFEARPVHRAFAVHPLLRFLANKVTLRGINLAEKLWPQNRLLRKTGGMLLSVVKQKYDSVPLPLPQAPQ